MRRRRTVHFISLGCPKNRVDTEVMAGVATGRGCEIVREPERAEIIVVNTCGFIGDAKRESIDTILEAAEMKRRGACKTLVVTGCLSQGYSKELEAQLGEVDHFLGSSDMLALGRVLDGGAKRMLVGEPAGWVMRSSDPRVVTGGGVSTYLKIAEGCDRTCAFCTIPRLRGKQRSRPEDDVVREAEQLAAQGVVELCVISQDTVGYGRDAPGGRKGALARLVERVADVRGVHWVRLLYLYPEALDPALVDLIAHHPRVVPYVDMPLQHAADTMLRRMRRGHDRRRQGQVIEGLREAVPGLFLRSAFIVGHPGETQAEFDALCDFVRWAELDHVGVFRYSDEDAAHSSTLPGKVPPLVAANRQRRLMGIQRRISRRKCRALVGEELEVLVVGPSEEHDLVLEGRHAGQAPDIDGKVFLSGGEAAAGQMRRVRVSQSSDYDLVGELVDDPPPLPVPAAEGRKKRVSLKVL